MFEDENEVSLDYYNSWFFRLGFLVKKISKNDRC